MKIRALILILFIFAVGIIHAQNEKDVESPINKNGVYLEIGGNGGNQMFIGFLNLDINSMLTINYERIFPINKNMNIAVRLGAGYIPQNWEYYTFPFELSYLYGYGIHHLEVGLGTSYLVEINKDHIANDFLVFFGRIGYRYQGKKGLLLRVGFTPAIDPDRVTFTNRFPINPFAGVSIGYSF